MQNQADNKDWPSAAPICNPALEDGPACIPDLGSQAHRQKAGAGMVACAGVDVAKTASA